MTEYIWKLSQADLHHKQNFAFEQGILHERKRILALVESLFSDSHWGEDVGVPCDCGQVTPLQIENVIALIKGENE